ncbi:unnamed protein product [Hermetia illucens]|uniref:Uncharacterized protein n=1 Tax=Hermetia illucens TaxID=343691 RepID=A0A7R8UM37_HERIL|nr:unnamed protein product [Hermetia illucens]
MISIKLHPANFYCTIFYPKEKRAVSSLTSLYIMSLKTCYKTFGKLTASIQADTGMLCEALLKGLTCLETLGVWLNPWRGYGRALANIKQGSFCRHLLIVTIWLSFPTHSPIQTQTVPVLEGNISEQPNSSHLTFDLRFQLVFRTILEFIKFQKGFQLTRNVQIYDGDSVQFVADGREVQKERQKALGYYQQDQQTVMTGRYIRRNETCKRTLRGSRERFLYTFTNKICLRMCQAKGKHYKCSNIWCLKLWGLEGKRDISSKNRIST